MSIVVCVKQDVRDDDILSHIEVRADANTPLLLKKIPFILTLDAPSCPEKLFTLASYGPTYLDIPSSMPKSFFEEVRHRYPKVKLIASLHDYEKTPENLEEIFSELYALSPDVIKIVGTAQSSIDGLRMLSFLQKHSAQFPLTAFCMGEKGSFTRILQPIYGGVWTYASIDDAKQTAPGQIAVKALKDIYHYEKLSPKTAPFALVGDPLHLSPSHITHNAIFRRFGKDAVYVKISLNKEEFPTALPYLRSLGFQGLSVTMPLKNSLHESLPFNTVHFQNGGQNSGTLHNTDGTGALDAIEDIEKVLGKKLLIFGAGATAESIAREAIQRGAFVTFHNRTVEKAANLAELLGCDASAEYKIDSYDIVVNATSADIEISNCKTQVIALDVRNSDSTPFLKRIQAEGGRAISGRKMWLRQAAKQLSIWCDMQHIEIRPSSLKGAMRLPPSKSQTLRALLFGSLSSGTSLVKNALQSPDTEAMICACRALGASLLQKEDRIVIEGIGKKRVLAERLVDAGNSGIVLRFIGAIAGLFSEELVITGDDSLKERRSCLALLEGLAQLGATVTSCKNHAPLSICGPIRAGRCEIDGEDSQPVSALLIAASLLSGTTEIRVRNLGEKPWVMLTLDWLAKMGVKVEQKQEQTQEKFSVFRVHGVLEFQPFEYEVPGDLSALAYPLSLGLVTDSDLIIQGVDLNEPQGDKKILSIYEKMGAKFTIDEQNKTISLKGPQTLKGIEIDANDCIDMVTILAVMGTFAEGVTSIYNAKVARDKESDRLACITQELKKMGALIEERNDGLDVRKSQLMPANLLCHNDHRMALALTVAAFCAGSLSTLHGIECIKKSYVTFFHDLKKIQV